MACEQCGLLYLIYSGFVRGTHGTWHLLAVTGSLLIITCSDVLRPCSRRVFPQVDVSHRHNESALQRRARHSPIFLATPPGLCWIAPGTDPPPSTASPSAGLACTLPISQSQCQSSPASTDNELHSPDQGDIAMYLDVQHHASNDDWWAMCCQLAWKVVGGSTTLC